MSINSEINRIYQAREDIKTSISNKGVAVPTESSIEDLPGLISAIPSGGSFVPDDISYSNWVAYGTSEPDPTKYKYWANINTTPSRAPITVVDSYMIENCFSGEICDEVFDLGTPMASVPGASPTYFSYDLYDKKYAISCSYGIYNSTSLYSSTTISVFDISGQDNPFAYMGQSSNSIRRFTLKDIFGKGVTYRAGGTVIVYHGKIYMMLISGTSTVTVYDIASGTTSTMSFSPMGTASNRFIQAIPDPTDSNYVILFWYTSSAATTLRRYRIRMSNLSYTTGSTLSTSLPQGLSGGYYIRWYDGTYAIFAQGTSSISTSSNTPMLILNVSANTYTTYLAESGAMYYFVPIIGSNQLFFRNLSTTVGVPMLEFKNGSIKTADLSSYGNLFIGLLNISGNSTPININPANNTFYAVFNTKSLTIEGQRLYAYTDTWSTGLSISGSTTRNYSFSSEVIESEDSSNKVLIPYVYNGARRSLFSVIYLNSLKDAFVSIPLASADSCPLYFNKGVTPADLKVSDGTKWTTKFESFNLVNDS